MKIFRVGRFAAAVVLVASFGLVFSAGAGALQPPRPGELERLEASGKLPAAIERAESYGNNRIAPELLERVAPGQVRLRPGTPSVGDVQTAAVDWPLLFGPSLPSQGVVKVPVVMIDFWDYPTQMTVSELQSKMSGSGNPSHYPVESLRNYYLRSSYGQLDLQPVVVGVYHYPGTRDSVGLDSYADEVALVEQAFSYFDARGHDFSQYDANNDGYMDYEIVTWTGPPGEWGSNWWGHYGVSGDPTFRLDGKAMSPWSWQWEPDDASADVVIHETGHALGLPDLYDYDGTVGPDGGVGFWDVMEVNTGDHNAFSKWMLGWLTPTVVSSGTTSVTMRPAGTYPDATIVAPGYSADSPLKEFFLFEARNTSGNDDVSAIYPADTRLHVWHFDARTDGYGSFLYDNSFASHKYARVMEADGLEEIETASPFTEPLWVDLYGPGQSFGPSTTPNSRFYDGSDSGVAVSGITRSGSNLTFTASTTGGGGGGGEGDGNDEIPGATISASPVTGTLDYSADRNDVYAIHLTAGQTLTASLTGAGGTDFDMRLYPPGTSSIAAGSSVAAAGGTSYPDSFTYVATTTGTFYLRVYSFSGTGSYSLAYTVQDPADEDDDIPGVPAGASPITGALDLNDDRNDVYRLDLETGDVLTARLTGPGDTDFDMGLFAPGSASLATGERVAYATSSAYPDEFTFEAPASGTYYLRVYAWSGSGNYALSYDIDTGSVVEPGGLERIAGSSRYATSARISERGFPEGADTVILTTGQSWPDALGGAALSGAYDAPVLLTQRDHIPDDVAAELLRLDPSQILILGGSGAVSEWVEWDLWSLLPGASIDRCAGTDRYSTSREIALRAIADSPGFDGTVFVATGRAFPDALAAAPLSAALSRPLFLTDPGSLSGATLSAMQNAGVNRAIVLGGDQAVSWVVEEQLNDAGIWTDRITGAGRYETALAIADQGVSEGLTWDGAGVAAGANFPDALSGGAMLGRRGSVMVLTPQSYLHGAVSDRLWQVRSEVGSLFILGGTGAVSDYVEYEVRSVTGLE